MIYSTLAPEARRMRNKNAPLAKPRERTNSVLYKDFSTPLRKNNNKTNVFKSTGIYPKCLLIQNRKFIRKTLD